ncbi:MAG: hypothetical protein HYW16_06810, partial [Candidatus Rokubacteria bacterium]|nr:hypothetical protein [Candidatus Rokubacteria bacterium]
MISVGEGQAHILAQVTSVTSPELIPVAQALGRVLADDLRAPFDVPPADNSAVDGYAVAGSDIPAAGTATLHVIADLPAGSVFDGTVKPGQAVRIMTGAPMPAGTDTVVPQELVERARDQVKVPTTAKGSNVRLSGEDGQARQDGEGLGRGGGPQRRRDREGAGEGSRWHRGRQARTQ